MNEIRARLRLAGSSLNPKKRDSIFKVIWKEYYPALSIYLKTSFNIKETDDPVQEIMLRVYKKLESYNPIYSFNTWIYSIARNHAIDFLKHESIVRKTAAAAGSLDLIKGETTGTDLQTPESLYMKDELRIGIAGFIGSLPEEERQISFLKYYEELNYRQISLITGIPAGTVKFRVHCIKKKFAVFFGENYED